MHGRTRLDMETLNSSNHILGVSLILASPPPAPKTSGPAWVDRRSSGNAHGEEMPWLGPLPLSSQSQLPGLGWQEDLLLYAEQGLYPLGCEWRRAV